MGDFNAAWGGERTGYRGNYEPVDNTLTRWTQNESLQRPKRTYQHTWESQTGPQKAHLDYILTWSPEGNPVSFSTDTLISPHPSHDHNFLKAKFSSSLIIRPTVSEAEVR